MSDAPSKDNKVGNFSIIETISVFKGKPKDFGWDETVIFYNDSKEFRYEKPSGTMDSSSGVICLTRKLSGSQIIKKLMKAD
jgi:hypothetical protein